MRLIPNRTGNSVSRPLRILALLRANGMASVRRRFRLLADMGHEVVYVDDILSEENYRKIVSRLDFDVAVLWEIACRIF